MGYYINPTDCAKEHWLEMHGRQVDASYARNHTAGDEVLVCLVDNGPFTAAGIAYDDRERDAFALPDGRPKIWYLVNRDLLIKEGFLDR